MKISTLLFGAFAAATVTCNAALSAPVSPNIIFGTAVDNGAFTIGTGTIGTSEDKNLEIGLRAKLRYDANGDGTNRFNYDGINTYRFGLAGKDVPANRAVFNYEWSITTDALGTGQTLNDSGLEFELSIDFDASTSETFISGDPFPFSYFGDMTTAAGGGVYAGGVMQPPSSSTVAQGSFNYGFLLGEYPSIPLGLGNYRIKLEAKSAGATLASTAITVEVAPVPLPAAFPLLALGVGGLASAGRRRKRVGRN